ncbi:ASCH domain-containing protein [Bradyrhizobium yuanmingense]|uniref:ASCH domain-containing protein n=1 Tax=Bradyrhizobium yuanmingense TaxID=108015 RepID=UPI0009451942|nr:ASCH domain-containing protein [Bradyrhizobium yuanmingense]
MKTEFSDFGEVRRLLADAPCLSIRQPWAELILLERKKVELRQWSTQHRGWVWLHTGKTFDEASYSRFGFTSLFTGGFVGAFRLRDVVPLDGERWDVWRSTHLDLGDCPANVFGWVITNPLRLEKPTAAPGSRGLYRPDAELATRLLAQPFVGEFEAS